MPDGQRKRRHSPNASKRRWYAHHRALRFARRFAGPRHAETAARMTTAIV